MEPLSQHYPGNLELFGGVEDWRGCATQYRDSRSSFGSIDQAGTAQQRREVFHLAMVIENLVMERRQEFRETHAFFRGDLLQRIPERHLQPDRRAMATNPQRPGLRFIVALRLVREKVAHGVPPGLL